MNWTVRNYNRCRLCNSSEIKEIFNFGESALANSYLEKPDPNQQTYPLRGFLCRCGSVQLYDTVNPDLLFKNYLYESSTSKSFVKHFEDYASQVSMYLGLDKKSNILEIGSNDNILLTPFVGLGFKNVYGVEPARNLVERNKNPKITLICDYFSEGLVENDKLNFLKGKTDLVCANNVFAHIDDLKDIVRGVKALLSKEGAFVFEVTHLLSNVKNGYFDMQYHEHIYTHGVKPLRTFFEMFGMHVFHVQEVGTHGGSIRCFVQKESASRKIDPSVREIVEKEENSGIYEYSTYMKWKEKIEVNRSNLLDRLIQAKNRKERVWAYGCPAKLTTFFKVMGIDGRFVDKVVDDSPLKQSMFTPGTNIEIVSKKRFEDESPETCLISAWNFAKQIKENNKNYKGVWIDPFQTV